MQVKRQMTLNFNLETYSQLLPQYQPRIIKTEEENERFLEVVEELISRSNLTPEEDALLELLVKMIEDFEDKHYQLNIRKLTSDYLIRHSIFSKNMEIE
jgi:HTH-type transcriptional regulator/antitoxin HigA